VTAANHLVIRDFGKYGRLWWLPANGYDNGLDASSWAPILDVDARAAMVLLNDMAAAQVPAYIAQVGPQANPTGHRRTEGDWAAYRLWVASSAFAKAEDVLMAQLPALLRRFGPGLVR
jgi:hypothetical protein